MTKGKFKPPKSIRDALKVAPPSIARIIEEDSDRIHKEMYLDG
jgi:hypothetical protein